MKAQDLISAAKAQTRIKCPPKLKAELAEVLAHNDTAPQGRKVTAAQAFALCEAHGVTVRREGLHNLLRQEFGRGWAK